MIEQQQRLNRFLELLRPADLQVLKELSLEGDK